MSTDQKRYEELDALEARLLAQAQEWREELDAMHTSIDRIRKEAQGIIDLCENGKGVNR